MTLGVGVFGAPSSLHGRTMYLQEPLTNCWCPSGAFQCCPKKGTGLRGVRMCGVYGVCVCVVWDVCV